MNQRNKRQYKPTSRIYFNGLTTKEPAMEDNELTSRLTTVLSELRDVMQQRKDKIEQLRAQITQIENENEDLERKVSELTNEF